MDRFLASVGNAEMFENRGGHLYHILSSKTLTETSLAFSCEQTDIRAGQGARLYAKFTHSASVKINLTDACLNLTYLGMIQGRYSNTIGDTIWHLNSQTLIKDSSSEISSVVMDFEPESLYNGGGCLQTYALIYPAGCDNPEDKIMCLPVLDAFNGQFWVRNDVVYEPYQVEVNETGYENFNVGENTGSVYSDGQLLVPSELLTDGIEYCVKYFRQNSLANVSKVYTELAPSDAILILTIPYYNTSSVDSYRSGPSGTITFKIPRFNIDGEFTLEGRMDGVAQLGISGTALDSDPLSDFGVLVEIADVHYNSTSFFNRIIEISIDTSVAHVGYEPVVLARYADGRLDKIDNRLLVFSPELQRGRYEKGVYYVSLRANANILDVVNVRN